MGIHQLFDEEMNFPFYFLILFISSTVLSFHLLTRHFIIYYEYKRSLSVKCCHNRNPCFDITTLFLYRLFWDALWAWRVKNVYSDLLHIPIVAYLWNHRIRFWRKTIIQSCISQKSYTFKNRVFLNCKVIKLS